MNQVRPMFAVSQGASKRGEAPCVLVQRDVRQQSMGSATERVSADHLGLIGRDMIRIDLDLSISAPVPLR
ncbi:MAG: hypothetical protein ABI671_09345 [Burkholderiales bacterium]